MLIARRLTKSQYRAHEEVSHTISPESLFMRGSLSSRFWPRKIIYLTSQTPLTKITSLDLIRGHSRGCAAIGHLKAFGQLKELRSGFSEIQIRDGERLCAGLEIRAL